MHSQNRVFLYLIGVLILGIAISSSCFVVDQTEFALVTRFGQVTRQIVQPGLNFKVPLIEDVVTLDNRIHNVDPPPAPLTLADKKRLDIDAFVRWRITDPLMFYKSMHSDAQAEQQLDNLINGALLDVFGKVPLAALLTEQRETIMQTVRDQVNKESEDEHFGLKIVDVRIGRANLPAATLSAVFQRMQSERKREAADYRAKGDQKSQEIRAEADANRVKIVSGAEKEAQDIRGEGDRQAIEIYAAAARLDPEFYGFYRSLQAYRTGLQGANTTFVLSPNSEFFRYFGDSSHGGGKTNAK